MLNEENVSSMKRHQLIVSFNTKFFNNEFYGNPANISPSMTEVETNRQPYGMLYQDVLELCINTDICKSLGMSVIDLMSLDLGSYTIMKDMIVKENERKSEIFNKASNLNKMKERQNAKSSRRSNE